jgi:hypothetical protein
MLTNRHRKNTGQCLALRHHYGLGEQHVIWMRSADQGKAWSRPVDVEQAKGPQASCAVLLEPERLGAP